jgi:ABC-type transport system substrate-binding protein
MHASGRHYGWMALGAWVGLLSACSAARPPSYVDAGPPVRGGTLKLAGGSDVDHLATTSAYTAHVIWLLRTFARELVTYPASPDFKTASEVVADLAETVPSRENGGISSDGLTYTFHLRHGVWWNSQPKREVTPDDIVRGIKLICNPVNPAGAPGYYESTILGMPEFCDEFAKVPGTVEDIKRFVQSRDLSGVQVGGDFTVRFTLQEPSPDFLNILAMPFAAPVPVEYLDYLPDSPEFRQHTISNGPYQIVKYTPGHEYQLDRNPSLGSRDRSSASGFCGSHQRGHGNGSAVGSTSDRSGDDRSELRQPDTGFGTGVAHRDQ